jgi:2-dehydro-3-deoxyglucarate aldolase
MGKTKLKLTKGQSTLGGWIMIGHPTVAELMAGEGFDWLGVDLEHTSTDLRTFHELVLAVKGTDTDLLVRMPGHDPELTKRVLDAGANGIIVPSVNTIEQAQLAVSMAKFPPEGFRGASLCRASDFGRNFKNYYQHFNEQSLVVAMIEHIDAVNNIDSILSVNGIDATLIGPYDMSASMGIAGKIDDPKVKDAQQKIVDACNAHNVPAGIHVVPIDPQQVEQRKKQGYKFIACSIDTEFIMAGCRQFLNNK